MCIRVGKVWQDKIILALKLLGLPKQEEGIVYTFYRAKQICLSGFHEGQTPQ